MAETFIDVFVGLLIAYLALLELWRLHFRAERPRN
jgi:hypothetical protein